MNKHTRILKHNSWGWGVGRIYNIYCSDDYFRIANPLIITDQLIGYSYHTTSFSLLSLMPKKALM